MSDSKRKDELEIKNEKLTPDEVYKILLENLDNEGVDNLNRYINIDSKFKNKYSEFKLLMILIFIYIIIITPTLKIFYY